MTTATNRLPDRLELRQRMYIQSRTQRRALWLVFVIIPLVVLATVALVLFKILHAAPDPAAMLDKALAKMASRPWDALMNLVLLAAVGLQVLYIRRAQQHERLILTPTGIEYRSPLPEALQALHPSWSLAWGQIRGATLRNMLGGRGPQTVALELDAGTRKLKLYPWRWVDPEHYEPLSPWQQMRELQRATPEATSAQIQESPALRYLAGALPHLAPKPDAKLASVTFALEKNPRSLAIVIAFFALALYALADTFFLGHETYAESAPFNAFIAAGVLAAVAAALWMLRARVPAAEGIVVALLFGGALGAACYPGALRVNAITDGEGLQKCQYQLTRERKLEPLTPGLPTLAFPQYYEYWEQFQPGSQHEFELRKGGLGFYQLNMQPVNEALHKFYETYDAPRRPRKATEKGAQHAYPGTPFHTGERSG